MQQTYALSRWVLACVDMQGLPSRLLLDEMAAAKDVDTALTAALKVVSCPWKHSFALVTSMMLPTPKATINSLRHLFAVRLMSQVWDIVDSCGPLPHCQLLCCLLYPGSRGFGTSCKQTPLA